MSTDYDMHASGNNGTDENTSVFPNSGFHDRDGDPSNQEPHESRFPVVFRVSGVSPDHLTEATAIRGTGSNTAPGVVGHGGTYGAGVLGIGGGKVLPGVVGLAGDETTSRFLGRDQGSGVQGRAHSIGSHGVLGINQAGTGVTGESETGFGVVARSSHEIALTARGGGRNAIVATLENQSSTAAGAIVGIASVGYGVSGESVRGDGVRGRSTYGIGVHGIANQVDGGLGHLAGVLGEATFGPGVEAKSRDGFGLRVTSENLGAVDAESSGPTVPAIYARSTGAGPNAHGVEGVSETGSGVQGTSRDLYGGQFDGGRAALRLVPTGDLGPPATGDHSLGEIVIDNVGDLYVCVKYTTPSTAAVWKKVAFV